MENKIILQVPFASPAFDELVALRDRILRKPLNLVFFIKDIEQEYEQVHLGCYDSNFQLLGCLTLLHVNNSLVKMRQVVVEPFGQKRGVGRMLVKASEKWAIENSYNKMMLHARMNAVEFYTKLGYRQVGKPFEEVGILHYAMELDLNHQVIPSTLG